MAFRLNGYRTRIPLEPGEVPVFEAEDMCKGKAHSGARHCAIGWAEVLRVDSLEFRKAYKRANGGRHPLIVNDDICKNNAERTEAMNRAMRAMGFTKVVEFEYEEPAGA